MRTYTSEVHSHYFGKEVVNVAAETFDKAVKKIKRLCRTNKWGKCRIASVVQTAKLDA